MRVVMTSWQTPAKGDELKPGDVAEFDDAEAARLVEVGGARHLTEAELEAVAAEAAAAGKGKKS